MSTEALAVKSLSQEQKVLLARGASANSTQPRLDVLITLTMDPDGEVSRLARETLARLSDGDCSRMLAESSLPGMVARYFLDPAHIRPALLPALLAHPASPQDAITELAAKAGTETMAVLVQHLDLLKTPALAALKKNPASRVAQKIPAAEALPASPEAKLALAREIRKAPTAQRMGVLAALASDRDPAVRQAAEETLQSIPDEAALEFLLAPSLPEAVARCFLDPAHVRPALLPLLLAHPSSPQDAITALAAAAGGDALRTVLEQLDLLKTPALVALKGNKAYLDWQKSPSAGGFVIEVDLLELLIQEVETESLAPAVEKPGPPEVEEAKEESVFGKIAKMTVAKKVVLALRGNKEERAILIRDGSKVVSRAVLASPKLSESEVESFATAKNVNQDVLRSIAMNRKFIKDYIVLKNLANNPRLPIDVGLSLINRLMPNDVRALANNRDISDTVRKMAHKLSETRGH